MCPTPTTADNAAPFEDDAATVLRQMRGALAQLVAAAPGGASKPVELSKSLGIDMKLSWSLFQIVGATDLLAAGQYVPRPGATRKLLQAATRHHVPAQLIERVSGAAEEFERLVKVHAGDRPTFDLMISGRASNGLDRIHLTHLRDAFRANSHIWGVQARTKLLAHFLQPGTEEDMADGAVVRGLIGFRRIRPNVPWIIARARCVDDDGIVRRIPARTPLEAPRQPTTGGAPAVPFLTEFCTHPLPACRSIQRSDGFVEHELVEGPVGRTAAITCVMGDVVRNAASFFRDEHNSINEYTAFVREPCEVLINDLFVHEDMFGPLTPELIVYGDLRGGPEYPGGGHEPPRLPVGETVDYLGKGPDVVATPDVPRYAELARYVFERLGWDGEHFDVYRVRLAYPVVPSIVLMRHPLRDKSAAR
jgi:hypothetical protein